jgi:hypothetical protein
MDFYLPETIDDVLAEAGARFKARLSEAERRHHRAIADRNWTQIRPWFYEDFAIHPIADPAIKAALRGESLPPRLERRAAWGLIRMFTRRLRHADRYPALSQASKDGLRLAIRCELRRLRHARQRRP